LHLFTQPELLEVPWEEKEMGPRLFPLLFSLLFFGLVGCGGGGGQSNPGTNTVGSGPTSSSITFTPDHVFVVMLENHSFAEIIGSPAMPYLNSSASQHALAVNYFANTHPSIGNYFMLTTGAIETNDDAFSGTISDNNIVRALTDANKTWKAYMESIPSAGYTGGDVYPYAKHHNPFAYLTDVLNSSTQTARIVPFTQISSDLKSGGLPNYGFIVPNLEHDAHDCPTGGNVCTDGDKLSAADNWLKTNIDPLINNPILSNSVFLIIWDEGDVADLANGGGQVATVVVGSHVKPAYHATGFYQHQSSLRLILDLLRVNDQVNAAGTAPSMAEFFQ
jgi:phosphatidylinositol-3-phosphatase